jgi:hypothetical protein
MKVVVDYGMGVDAKTQISDDGMRRLRSYDIVDRGMHTIECVQSNNVKRVLMTWQH